MRGKKPEQRLNHAQRRALNRDAVQDPPLPYAFMWSHPMLDGVQKYVEKLITICGPDYAYQTQEEFCKSSGCPREKLESWLREEWIQHNIHRVESPGREDGGRFLSSSSARIPDAGPCFCMIRLFSVKPGIGTPPAPTRQWKN